MSSIVSCTVNDSSDLSRIPEGKAGKQGSPFTSGNSDAIMAAASARCVGVATLGGASTR